MREIQRIYESINGLSAIDVKKIVEDNPRLFIRYFEAVIDNNGLIYFACPSHERKLVELCKKQQNIDIDKMDNGFGALDYALKYGYILVWYDHIQMETMNKFQKNSIDRLKEYGIINADRSEFKIW